MKNDARDWFIMVLVAGVWATASVFLFLHAEAPNFITWCGLGTTLTGVFHWLTVRDSKIPDAREGQ